MLSATFRNAADLLEKWFDDRAAPWLGGLLLVAATHVLANYAANIHWLAELIVTVVFAVLGLALLIGWKRKIYVGKYPSSHLFGMWLLTVILFIEVFASLSGALTAFQPEAYRGPAAPTRSVFVDLYAYHFVDSIPGLKIWDSFAVGPFAYRQATFAAGLLLLLFRSFVLAVLIGALKEWMTSRKAVTAATGAA